MIGLSEENGPLEDSSITFTKLINCVRFYDIPAINFLIISTLVCFLLKLTTKYKEMYMKSSLITIIVTNFVLYGISESLAQTLLAFKSAAPTVSLYVNGPIYPRYASNPLDLERGIDRNDSMPQRTSLSLPDETEIGEEDLDRFLDYLGESDAQFIGNVDGMNTGGRTNFGNNPAAVYKATYFQFYRLTGFMCWGVIMAFVQCWWYKFLQIYSKHPQFVEVLRKVMSDQFCFSPISLFCFFTYGTIVLEKGTWKDAKAKLKKLYLQTLVINYSIWFPVQFINFLLIPRDFQVPFSSSISVLWICFLSMRNSTA